MGKGLEKFKAEVKAIIENEKNDSKRKYLETTYGKIMTHLEIVCDDEFDAMLAQEHKSVERMWKFVNDRARKQAMNNVACIDDDDVYGWIDEYVGTDDKAEVEKELEQKRKRTEAAKNAQSNAAKKSKKSNQTELDFSKCDSEDAEDEDADTEDDDDENDEPKPSRPTPTKAKPAPKEDKQLDFFSMM